ncbi:MAG: sigma-70 family RNA polymerase sigma factor [Bacteroidales bacterium]|nr:sigma-70 family RNA polymerase sigma factor [Bacteroidales bacterium]
MIKYTNDAILDGIKLGDRRIVDYVYNECFPTIKFLITTNSGNELDAADIFQDALVIIFQKINTNDLNLTSSFKTFLYSICRNLWLQRLDRRVFNAKFLELEGRNNMQETLHLDFEELENEKYQIYQTHFLSLGKDCQKLLRLFLNKTPLVEIAKIMGFKTEKYAKTRKYLCKEKLKNKILNDPKCKKFF